MKLPFRLARLAALVVIVAALGLAGCQKSGDAPANPTTASASTAATSASTPKPVDSAMIDRYSAHGTVKSIDPDKKKLSIAHDDIPGFMKAMTMPFVVNDPSMLATIAVGDSVDFSFTDDGSGHLVIDKLVKK